MTLTLRLKKELNTPVLAECVSPDILAGKQPAEIAKLQIWEGNRKCQLGDIFEIKGNSGETPAEAAICLFGDLSKIRRIGAGMTSGKIEAKGDVGMHLGEEMKGGTISVDGNAGSWVGSAMKGGIIEVRKNAGDYIGGAYRGGSKGMGGGTIMINGNAGTEVGRYMLKGLIKIDGSVGQFVGIRMKNGTILVKGKAGERPGAFMTGGKIVLCNHVASVLPTFTIDEIKSKAKADGEEIKESFYLFNGDLAEHGKGKLYVSKRKNPHLKGFEKLLQ